MTRAISLTFGLFAVLAAGSGAEAARITKVKGPAILIDTQGDGLNAGDVMYAVNAAGKKKAIVRIKKLKGAKALGSTVKGVALAGMTLIPRGGGGAASATTRAASTGAGGLRRAYWGGLLGFAMDSMNVKVNSSVDNSVITTAALSGNGFSGNVLLDYEIFKQIWFRGLFGIEQFSVTGPAKCSTGNTATCDAQLIYGDLTLIARYVFTTGAIRPFIGAGLGLLFPVTKSSTALKAESIGSTNVVELIGGVDWSVSHNFYIPISVEYGLLPKSDQVDARWIALRAGMAFPF